jgi:predicted RNase H-like nuclease
MLKRRKLSVAGVDGCKAGWYVTVVSPVVKDDSVEKSSSLKLNDSFVAGTFSEVLLRTSDCDLVCVDIPIGLCDTKQRRCDLAARRILERPRSCSVFPPPIRACLDAKDYETASQVSLTQCGKKLNKQSFFILDKIRQVDDLMTPQLQTKVREIHPEVSFWALNGKKPMQYNKRKLLGRNERMELLSVIFPNLERIIARTRKPKEVAPDDILDALVAAWTAVQILRGKAGTLPQIPELDRKGLKMEIVYPTR